MVIVIDTREQLPYQFPCPMVRTGLNSGDYSLLGYEKRVAIERKKVVELFGCFTSDRDRFEREYQRLSAYDLAAVVIEGNLDDCLQPSRFSKVNPEVIVKSLISWYEKYGVPPIFAGTRANAEAFTFHTLRCFHRSALEEDSSSSYPAPEPAAQPLEVRS